MWTFREKKKKKLIIFKRFQTIKTSVLCLIASTAQIKILRYCLVKVNLKTANLSVLRLKTQCCLGKSFKTRQSNPTLLVLCAAAFRTENPN